jgi:hypothetical protein
MLCIFIDILVPKKKLKNVDDDDDDDDEDVFIHYFVVLHVS